MIPLTTVTQNKMKPQVASSEKIFAIHISNKRLLSQILKRKLGKRYEQNFHERRMVFCKQNYEK